MNNTSISSALDPQHLDFLDPDPQKCADHQRGKLLTKNCKKKLFTLKTQILTVEKRLQNFPDL